MGLAPAKIIGSHFHIITLSGQMLLRPAITPGQPGQPDSEHAPWLGPEQNKRRIIKSLYCLCLQHFA